MVNTKQKYKRAKQMRVALMLTGFALTFGWALILAVTTWLADLPCFLAPHGCTQGQGIAFTLLYAPILVGSFVLPAGILYNSKISESARRAVILISGVLLVVISFWLITIVGISIHGLS